MMRVLREVLLTLVVIGSGSTGVEMEGALAEAARHSLRGEFCRIAKACFASQIGGSPL